MIETVSYFLRNNSEVYACTMDMTKAFDLVKHSVLFRKLLHNGLPAIFVRLLFVMYKMQTAKVFWNGSRSDEFPLTNGVKQGAVLSAILYCVYMNGLFQLMRKSKNGCWVENNFLLSPSLDGLQEMLITCEDYAKEHNLKFSTDQCPKKAKLSAY